MVDKGGQCTEISREYQKKTMTALVNCVQGDDAPPPPSPILCSYRLVMSIMCSLGLFTCVAQRLSLSVAIVAMVNQTALRQLREEKWNDTHQVSGGCKNCKKVHFEDNVQYTEGEGEFIWSKETQGIILSSFYWGFAVAQLLGAWFSQRYGGRRVWACSMLVCSLLTLLTPIAARIDSYAVVAVRVVLGLFQSVMWPSVCVLFARWVPPLENGRLTSFATTGSLLGAIITLPVVAQLCELPTGWSLAFYITGGCGFLWVVFWGLLVYDSPDVHPRISSAERLYITHSIGKNVTSDLLIKSSS
ncbi:vesicular glutamate transporter 1 [Aplysia californica]|uniref:Vesicular glutamate transporter 1 n=1 Tax=Aplysia californica TaxID=6500 RepID=A0ABM1A5X8_APLCA|nr:vesicular glutamate transporter 1 [Aplysia californica]